MRARAEDVAAAALLHVGNPYAQEDCQALVENCVMECGGEMAYAGSNDMARHAAWLGTLGNARAEGKIVPGAGLLIHEDDESGLPEKYRGDGLGDFSHIGLYVGEGALEDVDKRGKRRKCEVVHSSSTMGRVAGSTLANGWTHVMLFREIDYGMYGAEASPGVTLGAECGEEASFVGADGTKPRATLPCGEGSGAGNADDTEPPATLPCGDGSGAGNADGAKPPATLPCGEGSGAGNAGAWAARSAEVTSPNGGPVKLRPKPNRKSTPYWLVAAGTRVQVERERGGWALVSAQCTDGYTRRAYMMARYLDG